MKLFLYQILSLLTILSCESDRTGATEPTYTLSHIITPGAHLTENYFPLIQGKKIGLVINQTSQIGQTPLLDTLINFGIRVQRIFTPEHGYKGTADAGKKLDDVIDSNTQIDIISLYGKKLKPSIADLQGIEVMLFDIQDVGVRFYTYISTLHYIMEACAEANIPLIILDRPNPLASYVDGPILDISNKSFVGMHPVPVVYGMTIGEYAQMINGEGWLANGNQCKLSVIQIANYTHEQQYILTVLPSPNLPNNIAIGHYPSLCLFEGTTCSVGRGTDHPFQSIGHPAISEMTFQFTPVSKTGASSPKHQDKLCYGEDLSRQLPPKKLDLQYLIRYYELVTDSGEEFFLDNNFFDLLAGTNMLRDQLIRKIPENEIRASWADGLEQFAAVRQKYLIYP